MPPPQEMRVLGQFVRRLQVAGHHERADVKVNRVPVGRAAGVMPETAIGVAARQRPIGGAVHRFLAILAAGAEMLQHEDGVEAGVPVARQRIEHPASVRLLILERAGQDQVGLRCFDVK